MKILENEKTSIKANIFPYCFFNKFPRDLSTIEQVYILNLRIFNVRQNSIAEIYFVEEKELTTLYKVLHQFILQIRFIDFILLRQYL